MKDLLVQCLLAVENVWALELIKEYFLNFLKIQTYQFVSQKQIFSELKSDRWIWCPEVQSKDE